ncbi:MAG: cation-translocating P-type ATPase [Anaerolineae bacterium]|nr:cation-translocating P-type ATPase [Anaerolineae bacterium]
MSTTSQLDQVWTHEVSDVLNTLSTDREQGLSTQQAADRLTQYGLNELEERGGKSPFSILWEQFTSTMVLILIAAAVLSGFLGKTLETVAISAIVVLFGFLGFIQEYRAEQAMAALKQLTVPIVRVRRDGKVVEISARELVPGDIVLLEAGSSVPADLRLIESANLRIQEAALTGESEPVEKQTAYLPDPALPLADRRNMAFTGTSVSYGRGIGVVVETGMNTELGRIAELIQDVEEQKTPLQHQLNRVGQVLAAVGVVVALLILGIGVLLGETVSEMFLTAISVAVAVVPEGLPAVVTVTLALGAQRMLRRRTLIRKLPAVETLGAVSVICSDKTGTLTENRMTVTIIDVAGHYLELVGTSKLPAPTLTRQTEPLERLAAQPPSVELALVGGALCNDASLKPDPETGRFLPIGDPTEGALLVAAQQTGLKRETLENNLPRVAELPFDSERKRMTTVHRLSEEWVSLPRALGTFEKGMAGYVAFTKGSVDGLLEVSDKVWVDDHAVELDASWKERILVANDEMALNGMRVLGIAFRLLDDIPHGLEQALEERLVFVGLVGMIDPPRSEVKAAIQTCKAAGIRPIMITGDHPLTARFIAHDLGISENNRVKTGQDLDRISQAELGEMIDEVSVYARVTPEHKLRIVETLQARNQVVAMTGDGVNDSPALKKADIGVAMGITGTDVSKEAAQMVLLDDNFSTIVAAVEEGRAIYENIRRFVKFSIAGNLGKVLVMLIAPFIGIPVALLPLQLLWLNLLTDGLLGLGLGMEPADRHTMQRPPRGKSEVFLSPALRRQIVWVGMLIGLVALGVGYGYFRLDDIKWQTMIFTTLAFLQIGQALSSRSDEESAFTLGLRTNPTLFAMVLLTFGLQLAAIYMPFLDEFFEIVPLSGAELLISIGLGSVAFFAIEIEKWLRRRRHKRVVLAGNFG